MTEIEPDHPGDESWGIWGQITGQRRKGSLRQKRD